MSLCQSLIFIFDYNAHTYISDDTNKIILDKPEPDVEGEFYYEPENEIIKSRNTDMVFDWSKGDDGKYYIIAKAYTGKESQRFKKAKV